MHSFETCNILTNSDILHFLYDCKEGETPSFEDINEDLVVRQKEKKTLSLLITRILLDIGMNYHFHLARWVNVWKLWRGSTYLQVRLTRLTKEFKDLIPEYCFK